MLECVEEKKVYLSPSGIQFKVDWIARHGQDCSHAMVCYTNLEPTKDYPALTKWVISESLFLKQFTALDKAVDTQVVFLDFDGVFTITYERTLENRGYVSDRAVAFLDKAIVDANAKIVVSSTWRIGEDHLRLSTYLDLAGFRAHLHPDFRTKSLTGFRGDEVREWLSRHPEVTRYAIVDDETDFHEDQLDYLVHVDMVEGFGARDHLRLKSVFGKIRDEQLVRPFKPRGIARDLTTYYENYMAEKGEG